MNILLDILIWLVVQLWFLLFAVVSAHHQYPALFALRKYVTEEEDKTLKLTKQFHENGFIISFSMYLALQNVLLCWFSWPSILFMPIAAAIYSRFFDRAINKKMGNPIDFIGTHSAIDKWFRSKWGEDAGAIKNRYALYVIGAGNILFFILYLLLCR